MAICLTLPILAMANFAQNELPKAVVKEVKDTYFGQEIIDPYRWMEDAKSPETQAWIKAELLKRIAEVSNTGVRVGGVQRRGEQYFYFKTMPNENDRRLYVRDGLNGTERLLVDPEKFSAAAGGKRYTIAAYSPSNDGKLISYLMSPGGEYGEIRVMEVATGKDTGDRIENMRWEAGAWMPDNRSFAYVKFQTLPADAPQTEKLQKVKMYLHTLGERVENDRPLFGYEVNPNVKIGTTPLPFVYFPRGSKYAVAYVNSGVSRNSEYYLAPIESLNQNPIPWRKISSLEDEIRGIEIQGDDLFLLTYKNTPRYKIIRTSVKNPDLSQAAAFFPASNAVVESMGAARDALYVQTLDGGSRKIYRVDYKTGKSELIKLPYDGSAYIAQSHPNEDGIWFSINSWTKSPSYFAYDPNKKTATDLKIVPPIPIDMSQIEATTVQVKSHDGVLVPLVIIYKKGIKRDGRNPTVMGGYGAYGVEQTSPAFMAGFLPWLERGGILALAGVRGGGEYGAEWHLAGKGANKPNTWKDFIACAEYLIAEKYTAPAHLGIQGGSAGGILISRAITERPELFGAALSAVGLNNTLRAETTANGVPNIPEFGTFKTEEGFKALLEMDGYHKVKDGVKYPAVLLTHGINDPRVEPWMSAKMAARLQAASTSGKPILMRIDYDAGHGSGLTKEQRNAQSADVMAFFWEQLGGATTKTVAN
jgi:prolyl oligopeptidase